MDVTAIGWRSEPTTYCYDWKQLALYALGIGAQATELPYVYEAMGPKVYPSFAVVAAFEHASACFERAKVPLSSVIHTGQSVQVLGPIGGAGELTTYGEIVGFYDLKRFAQMLIRTVSHDQAGAQVFACDWMILLRDQGGFGGPVPPKRKAISSAPKEPANWTVCQKTSPEQALLYRLSGDTNPLHIDPLVASQAGFDQGPILHGLATFGFATRAITQAACAGDASKISIIEGQFRRPVWPGDTLVTSGWHREDQCVYVTSVQERNEVVLTGAWQQREG